MATRQKHNLKIADQSDFGWGTVARYQEDLLASGPEGEKEIDRTESHAEKGAKKDTESDKKRSRGGGEQLVVSTCQFDPKGN